MDMRTRSDENKLLKRCLKGDSKAFEVIVGRYQELVCAVTIKGTVKVIKKAPVGNLYIDINSYNTTNQSGFVVLTITS